MIFLLFFILFLMIGLFIYVKKLNNSIINLNQQIVNLNQQIVNLSKKMEYELNKTNFDISKYIDDNYVKSFNEKMEQSSKEFHEQIKEAYDEACKKIDFDRIEYKKVITKRRKKFIKDNADKAVPEKIWRSLDEF